jgi:hypothetical protein
MKNEFTGNGPFLHDDPRDRPLDIFGGKTTLHLGGQENFVLLPVIPPRGSTQATSKAKAKPARRAAKKRRR